MRRLTMIRYGLCATFLLLLSFVGTHAQARVKIVPFEFKSPTLEGRVAEAVQQGKKNYIGPILFLMEAHKNNPDEVLTLLKPYLDDPDEGVRITIIEAAAQAPHSTQALQLLTALAPYEDIGHQAILILYTHYTCQQLIEKGGKPLKRALFRAAFKSRYTRHGYLLLSCYKGDPALTNFLEQRRRSYRSPQSSRDGREPIKPSGKADESAAEAPRDTTSEVVALDLALAELGKADALQRVMGLFAGKNTKELLTLLRYLKFVNNKAVLLRAVELLKDKSKAREVRSADSPHPIVAYSRLCDEALVALYGRAGIAVNKKREYEHLAPTFSDQELSQAYERLKTVFSST